MVNCGSDGIEVCWDQTLGRWQGPGAAPLTVRHVGGETARCAEKERVYLDITDISAAYIHANGEPGQLTVTINQNDRVYAQAELYGGFEPEFLAVTDSLQFAPALVIANIDPSARVTAGLLVEAFGLVDSEPAFARVTLEERDSAFQLIFEQSQADGGRRADMWDDLRDLIVARLSNISLVTHRQGIRHTYYIVGKTDADELVGLKVRGPQ